MKFFRKLQEIKLQGTVHFVLKQEMVDPLKYVTTKVTQVTLCYGLAYVVVQRA